MTHLSTVEIWGPSLLLSIIIVTWIIIWSWTLIYVIYMHYHNPFNSTEGWIILLLFPGTEGVMLRKMLMVPPPGRSWIKLQILICLTPRLSFLHSLTHSIAQLWARHWGVNIQQNSHGPHPLDIYNLLGWPKFIKLSQNQLHNELHIVLNVHTRQHDELG